MVCYTAEEDQDETSPTSSERTLINKINYQSKKLFTIISSKDVRLFEENVGEPSQGIGKETTKTLLLIIEKYFIFTTGLDIFRLLLIKYQHDCEQNTFLHI